MENPVRLVLVEMGPERATFKVGNKILDLTTRMPLLDGKYEALAGYELEVKNGVVVRVNDAFTFPPRLVFSPSGTTRSSLVKIPSEVKSKTFQSRLQFPPDGRRKNI